MGFKPLGLIGQPGAVRLFKFALALCQCFGPATDLKLGILLCRQDDGVNAPVLFYKNRFGLGQGTNGTKPVLGVGCSNLQDGLSRFYKWLF